MDENIIIRADASTRIGSGHAMRCLTLAEELRKGGAKVSFISRIHPGNLNELILEKGFQCFELPCEEAVLASEGKPDGSRSEYATWLGVSQRRDAEETIKAGMGLKADWLIVDHYGLDEEWEKMLRPHVRKIMVIDDLADRRHDCDLLLDQNFFVDGEKRYDELVPQACTKLLGPNYALLREEFRKARENLKARSGEVKKVLVFFGGTDPENITGLAIEALSDPKLLHLDVDVVIGVQNQNRESIERLVNARPRTTLHIQVANMAELMSAADLAIGAGGSTTWERLCLGLTSMVVVVAENQRVFSNELSQSGISDLIDKRDVSTARELCARIESLVANPIRRKQMEENGKILVSGGGAIKVALTMIGVDVTSVI